MSKKEQLLKEIFQSIDLNKDSYISKEDLQQSFLLTSIEVSEKITSNLFTLIDKDLDSRISLEEFRRYFFESHKQTPIDNLIYQKMKKCQKKLNFNKFFEKMTGALPLSVFEKDVNEGMLEIGFGNNENQEISNKLAVFLDFKDEVDVFGNGITIRFRLEKGGNYKAIYEEFQKNFKGLLLVGQNLNKRFKEILKELNFAYNLSENPDEIHIIIKFSDISSKYLYDFQTTIASFFQSYQKSESFRIKLQFKHSLDVIMNKFLDSPILGISSIFSDSKLELSGYIRKVLQQFIEISKESLAPKWIEDLLGSFLLLRSLKMRVQMNNFSAEDIENSGFMEFLPETSFFLKELPAIELPKMPIIKKFYQMFGNGFQERIIVEGRVEGLVVKAKVKTKGIGKVIDRGFKI